MIMAYTAEEYYLIRDQLQILSAKAVELSTELREQAEQVEILRAERSHWYHMYNQESHNEHS